MHTLKLNDYELEQARRGMLDVVYNGLERTLDLVDRMRQQPDLDEGPAAGDVRGSIECLLRELAALDALGWYDGHYTQEVST
jgi:hypothetical protein